MRLFPLPTSLPRGAVFSFPAANPDSGEAWCYALDLKKAKMTHAFDDHIALAAVFNAAPEMLGALRDAIKFGGLPYMADKDLKRAVESGLDGEGKAAFTLRLRAIIAKAEGKS